MTGETERHVSGWTVDTLHAHLRALLDERTEQHAQRFEDQQIAMHTAFDAAQKALDVRTTELDKEFHEHLIQYRHEVQMALDAADKAVTKSEAASEKRFESVNEFRAQLTDQAHSFMPRQEAEAAINRGIERVEEVRERMNDLADSNHSFLPRNEYESRHQNLDDRVTALTDRFNLIAGQSVGRSQLWTVMVAMITVLGTLVVVVNILTSR